MLKKLLVFTFILVLELNAVWTEDSNAVANEASGQEAKSDTKESRFSIALSKPIGWDIEQGIIGTLFGSGSDTSTLTLFEFNTYGGWDIGYDYNFHYSVGEGIDVSKSDAYSNPQLLTRADFNIGAKAWLKFNGPGVWLDYWSPKTTTSKDSSNYYYDKWSCPTGQDHKLCFDIFKLLGTDISINEELETKSLKFNLPFKNDNDQITLDFQNGIYDNDFSKTTALDLAYLAGKIPYPPVVAISKIVDVYLGVVRGIDSKIDFSLDSIDYTLKDGTIGSQNSLDDGFLLNSFAGKDITVSKRDYNIGMEPEIGAGLAVYTEVGILGWNIALYYPLEGSNPPHLVKAELKPTDFGFSTDRFTVSPSLTLDAKYSVPSNSNPATLEGNVSLSVLSYSSLTNGYIKGTDSTGKTIIDCGSSSHTQCIASNVIPGSVITLQAYANGGYTPNWYSSCKKSGIDNKCVIKVDKNSILGIKFVDMTAPIVNAPADITRVATSVNSSVAVNLGQASAIDAINGSLISKNNLNTNTPSYKVGEYSVLWSATDSSGNKGVDIQRIKIKAPENAALFKSETIPDNTGFYLGETFTKKWTLINVGTNTWNSNYCLMYDSGFDFGNTTPVCVSGSVQTGSSYTFSVPMKAPSVATTVRGDWKLAKSGVKFSTTIWNQIIAKKISSPIWPVSAYDRKDTSIYLFWNRVNDAQFYRLYYSSSINGVYNQIYSGTGESFSHTNLISNTSHYYKVKACLNSVDESSCSDYSSMLSVKTVEKEEEELEILPETNLSVLYNSDTDKFTLNWRSNDVTNSVTIQYSFDNSSWYSFLTSPDKSGTLAKQLANSKNYNKVYLKVISVNENSSIESSVTTQEYSPLQGDKPSIPQLYNLSSSINKDNINLYWKKVYDKSGNDNITHYELISSNTNDFSNLTPENIGNVTSYKVENLEDDKKYYFKIRAVNQYGEGSWSTYEYVKVSIEDLPNFELYHYPLDNSTGISKLLEFDWKANDPDGDDLEYYVKWGEDQNNLNFGSGWITKSYFRIDGVEEKELKPNTTYYWQVIMREDGRLKDYYGGAYPLSHIRSFTTVSEGSDLSITNVELLSELKPDSRATFRVTLKNIGTEVSDDENIYAYYKKGNDIWPFREKGTAGMDKTLSPGETLVLDMEVGFNNEVEIFYGKTYDNVLIEGDNYIVFDMPYLDDQDVNPSNNRYEKKITYVNKGAPVFEDFYLVGSANYNNLEGRYVRPNLGDSFKIYYRANDDLKITKSTIEYRLNDTDSWHLITTIVNDANDEDISESYYWEIPEDNNLITNSAEIRVRIYENDNSFTEKVSYPFPIESNLLDLTLGSIPSVNVGEEISLELNLNNDYSIRYLEVTLYSNGKEEELYKEIDENGISIESFYTLRLPNDNRFANDSAYLEVKIKDSADNSKTINSNIFNLNADTKLNSVFGDMIDIYNIQYDYPTPEGKSSYGNIVYPPSYGINTSTDNIISFVELDENNIVHMIVSHTGNWRYNYYNGAIDDDWFSDTEYLYITYNYDTKVISTPIKVFNIKRDYYESGLPSNEIKSFRLINGVPNVLTFDEDGNILRLFKKNGNSFVSQVLSSNNDIDNIEFVQQNDNYYVHYRVLPESGLTEDRRHTVQKIYPTSESEKSISPNEYLGGSTIKIHNETLFVPYTGKLYNLNSDMTIGTVLKDFGSNNVYLLNTNNLELGQNYHDLIIDENKDIYFIKNDLSLEKIGNFADDYYINRNSKTRMDVKVVGNQAFFIHSTINPNKTTREIYNVVIVDLETKLKHNITVGNTIDSSDVAYLSSINNNKLIALGQPDEGSAFLAIGNFSTDVIEPTIYLSNKESNIENNQSITLNWSASDNDDELIRYDIYKVIGGSETFIDTISNTQQTSYSYTINESNADQIKFKVVAYDLSGNSSFATLSLNILNPINFNYFTINKTTMTIGEKLIFQWSSDGDSTTKYSIYRRGSTEIEWTKILSLQGVTVKSLLVDNFVGEQYFKIVSGNDELEASNAVTIEGEILNFNNEYFTPKGNYFGSNLVTLKWNDTLINANVFYNVLVKKASDTDFELLGKTSDREFEFINETNESFTWKIITNFNERTYTSDEIVVTPASLISPVLNEVNFNVDDENSLYSTLSFSNSLNATEYVIVRKENGLSVEVGKTNETTFIDTSIKHSKNYTYSIIAKNGEFESNPSNEMTINTSFNDTYSVVIDTQNYQTLNSNFLELNYHPSEIPEYESYEILLGTSPSNLFSYSITSNRTITLDNLDYGTTYYIEVYPLEYNGIRVTNVPAKLTFVTGFDNRVLEEKPEITLEEIGDSFVKLSWTNVDNADEYYICRAERTSIQECFTRVTDTSFYDDINIDQETDYRYQIVAKNSNMYISSDYVDVRTLSTLDTDQDGIADITDTDDDNDGVSDTEEIKAGTDPKDENDYPNKGLTQKEKTLMMILLNRSNQLNKDNVEKSGENSSTYIKVPTILMIEALKEKEKE